MKTTKYYRATYITETGKRVPEVFASDSMEHAKEYALRYSLDRDLETIEEFQEWIDALL